MNQWFEIFIGFCVILLLMVIGKVILKKYLIKRKEDMSTELSVFETAIGLNKPDEINKTGAKLVNNPNFEINHLRRVMELLLEYKSQNKVNKDALKKLDSAILNRQLNWGLFASRYTDSDEYEEAKKDLINLP